MTFEPVHVTGTHYMLYANGDGGTREPERFETADEVLAAYGRLLDLGYRDVQIRTVVETAPGPRPWAPDGITYDDLLDDPVRELHSKLMRPLYAFQMSAAMLDKKFTRGDKSPAAASAETRYRNARREILAVLTEYQENNK